MFFSTRILFLQTIVKIYKEAWEDLWLSWLSFEVKTTTVRIFGVVSQFISRIRLIKTSISARSIDWVNKNIIEIAGPTKSGILCPHTVLVVGKLPEKMGLKMELRQSPRIQYKHCPPDMFHCAVSAAKAPIPGEFDE